MLFYFFVLTENWENVCYVHYDLDSVNLYWENFKTINIFLIIFLCPNVVPSGLVIIFA